MTTTQTKCELDELKAYAARTRRTFSDVVRDALLNSVKEES